MESNTTLYCCYHDDSQIVNRDSLVWIFGPDDPLNLFLSEFSAFRYIFEHDTTSEYIGISHYRRRILPINVDYNWLDNDHCIAYSKLQHFPGKPTDNYSIRRWSRPDWYNCRYLYFDWIDYIRQIGHVEYFEGDEKAAYLGLFITHSSVLMNRYHFMNMCQYVLGYFDYIDDKYGLNKDPDKYKAFLNKREHCTMMKKYRLFAYMGEWIVSNYITTYFDLNSIKFLHDHDHYTTP